MIRLISLITLSLLTISLGAQNFVDVDTNQETLPDNSHIGQNWELEFSDEFNQTAVDETKWKINNSSKSRSARASIGISKWFWKPHNVWVENGNLALQVEKYNSNTMYCGSVYTQGIYETQYGYFESRIKIAETAKGTHTTFWLQGNNMSNVDGTANDGAEIDIFESAWLDDYTKSVIHIDGYASNHQANTKKYDTPGIHEGYHTFGLHWTEDFMDIYYDGQRKVRYTNPNWIVKTKEFLWLSDGASFGLEGDCFTKQDIGVLTCAYVDYIRVWKPKHINTSVVCEKDIDISVRPNPSEEGKTINITSSSIIEDLQIYNTSGKMVASLNNIQSKNINQFNPHLSQGIYLLCLNNDKLRTQKIIIK